MRASNIALRNTRVLGAVALGGVLLCASVLRSQTTLPRYETVSIKPSAPGTVFSTSPLPGGKFIARGMPAGLLIQMAYRMEGVDINGMPDWVRRELFDVEAVPARALSRDEVPLALRAMLADRFSLASHIESRTAPGYELSVARGGPKLTLATPPTGVERSGLVTGGNASTVTVTARDVPLSEFVETLSRALGEPVSDKTGLKDRYDFTVEWVRHDLVLPASPDGPLAAGPAPSIFSSVEDTLGLKLSAVKVTRDTLVIDHIERPSPN